MILVKMSAPASSVPSRCRDEGPARIADGSIAYGFSEV